MEVNAKTYENGHMGWALFVKRSSLHVLFLVPSSVLLAIKCNTTFVTLVKNEVKKNKFGTPLNMLSYK